MLARGFGQSTNKLGISARLAAPFDQHRQPIKDPLQAEVEFRVECPQTALEPHDLVRRDGLRAIAGLARLDDSVDRGRVVAGRIESANRKPCDRRCQLMGADELLTRRRDRAA